MTYNVFGGTLNLAQLNSTHRISGCCKDSVVCTNCKNNQYKVYKPFLNVNVIINVCYFLNAYTNVYYYSGRLTHLCYPAPCGTV